MDKTMKMLILLICGSLFGQNPVTGIHAHNDYQHKRPLLEAVEQGFDSVEADIFLREGKLLIGHFAFELKPERTLDSLYLAPLAKLHKEGKIKSFWLMIDIKTNDGVAAAKAIEAELLRYPEMFQRVGEPGTKPVKVLMSGNSPRDWVLAQEKPLLRLDGREPDLGIAGKAEVIPWVSEPWTKHFTWKGKGSIPEDQKAKLTNMAKKAASAGQQLRFWGAPDVPECWKTQRECGVQRIGTDKLKQLAEAVK